MSAAAEAPCANWVTWEEVTAVCTPASVSAAIQAQILASVTRTLWNRSCRQFGECTITRARLIPNCRCKPRWPCTCGAYYAFDLGTAPVISVGSVWIDGAVVSSANYRVDDWKWLVRVDGESWPSCTDPGVAQGGERTFEATWTYGLAVPTDGKLAAALYACKMSRDIAESCGVPPANASSIARDGVQITINPPEGNQPIGVQVVDEWLANFHCGGARMFDPGARSHIMRVGT